MIRSRILKRQDGFTMIEIIAVLILIGILAAVAVPKFLSLQKDAELKSINGVKMELTSRANQYFAQYLLDNTKTTNSQNAAAWALEDIGADFTLSRVNNTTLRVTVASSGNRFRMEFTPGRNATDGTGYAAKFGAITAE